MSKHCKKYISYSCFYLTVTPKPQNIQFIITNKQQQKKKKVI